jgi:hypothetical protein
MLRLRIAKPGAHAHEHPSAHTEFSAGLLALAHGLPQS